ncbi:MAG: hypothetical protein OHK0046_47590 [Anaerolineae bacterium]
MTTKPTTSNLVLSEAQRLSDVPSMNGRDAHRLMLAAHFLIVAAEARERGDASGYIREKVDRAYSLIAELEGVTLADTAVTTIRVRDLPDVCSGCGGKADLRFCCDLCDGCCTCDDDDNPFDWERADRFSAHDTILDELNFRDEQRD